MELERQMMDLQLFRKKLQKSRSICIMFIAGCLVLAAAVVCCILLRPRADKPDAFFLYMQDADVCYANGDKQKALHILEKSKKSAISSINWLSLLKRCIEWSLFDDAIKYASEATCLFPGNETISAVSCYACILAHNNDLALQYARTLTDGVGVVMNAYLQSKKNSPTLRDPTILASAGAFGKIPALQENAAVLYAVQGNLDKAVSLSPDFYSMYTHLHNESENDLYRISELLNPLFWLTLQYDQGDVSQVFQLSSIIIETDLLFDQKPTPKLLSLQADSAIVSGDRVAAFEAWQRLALFYPHYSPEVWYNLAYMSDKGNHKFAFLHELLTAFPGYSPALHMLASEAIRYEKLKRDDPIESALTNAGMKSISMLEKENNWCINRIGAQQYFDRMKTYFAANNTVISAECALEQKRFEWAFLPPERAYIDIWRLLELYPESEIINRYAVWFFFASAQPENGRIVLEHWESSHESSSWTILANAFFDALSGDIDEAQNGFRSVSAEYGFSWQLFANISIMEEYAQNWNAAIDLLTLALSHINEVTIQSRLHYEIGRILAHSKNLQGARTALRYSLDLDPSNYDAKVLLMSLY